MGQPKILIITTSGGAGHLRVAEATKQKLQKKHPDAEILIKELFLEWGFKSIGKKGIDTYNRIQREGSIKAKERIVNLIILADVFFGIKFFLSFLVYLFKENIDQVIDTQPVGTAPIIKAIRIYNKINKRKLFLEKRFVDFPTKRSKVFYRNIKYLSKNDKKHLKIVTFPPLLEDVKSKKEFWYKYCRLNENNVSYEPYFIREEFQRYVNAKLSVVDISIETKSEKEKRLLLDVLDKSSNKYTTNGRCINFNIEKNDIVTTILLGSQPAVSASIQYVKNYTDIVKSSLAGKKHFLFVFCDDIEKLFVDIHKIIVSDDHFPENLSVVLMSYQKESVIAPLFSRSNYTITRSGGSTVMELLSISKGKVLIHSEAKDCNLLHGIPYWEAGNALYLFDKINGQITTPDLLRSRMDI